MNLILSLDYELFFGDRHGSPQRCLIEPCRALLKVTDRVAGKLAFFVDAGYLCKLEENGRNNLAVQREADLVFRHLDGLSHAGHELHLHIHPHWEDTRRGEHGWQFDLTRYALQSFPAAQIQDIVKRYKNAIARFVGPETVFCYRAGGWVIQPFGVLAPALRSNGIWLDSSVFPGGVTKDSTQSLDFRRSPDKDHWSFDTDPLTEESHGYFLEIPIASIAVAPWAYWNLTTRKLAGGARHRPWGNGRAISLGKRDLGRKLLSRTTSVVSIDGPKAGWLESAYREHQAKGRRCFVVMGHPKALTPYSIHCLEQFLGRHPEINLAGYSQYEPVLKHEHLA
jgi:hypothetical protein